MIINKLTNLLSNAKSNMVALREEIRNLENYYNDLSVCSELHDRAFFNYVYVGGLEGSGRVIHPIDVLLARVNYGISMAFVQPCHCNNPDHDHQAEIDDGEEAAMDVVRDVAAALLGREIEFGDKISNAFHSYGPDWEHLEEEYAEIIEKRNMW